MVGCYEAMLNIMGDMVKKVDKHINVAPHIDFSAAGKNVITEQPFAFKSEPGTL